MTSLRFSALTAVMTLAAVAAAIAEGKIIHQKGRLFSVDTIEVHRGEPVTFFNDDTVPHNIMSVTEGNAFNMGSQMPGTAIPISFDTNGLVAVICAIHPRMHMTVKVTD